MAAKTGKRTAHVINERERTSDVLTEENTNVDFGSMFLSEPVTLGLEKVGFEKPSPIQLKAIPLGRCGLDLIVQAKSGTGKTCVFSVIALEGIDLSNTTTQVLVLAPTREIAVQIQDTIQAIGCEMEALRCHVFIGGTLFGPDRQKMKKCHIAVGTPGRIKQLIEYEVLKTDAIRLFVLDEADKLLDDTFQEQVNWIYNQLSDNKQMLALSATYPEYLAKHLTKYMREPMFVRLNPKDLALRGIKQFYVELPGHSLPNKAFEIKVVKLMKILSQISFNQCLIFSNLQTRAQNLCDILDDCGWPSECISGAKEQSERLSAMAKLKKFQCRILISTDLTARGIDAENVNLIINLDIPTDSKTYLHRIGRAGRFGTHGASISLASKGREVELLRNIQRQCRVMMTELPDPAPSDLLKQDINSTGLPLDSTSLISSSKKNPTRNTSNSIDNLEDDVQSTDSAVSSSSLVNGDCLKSKSVIKKSIVNGDNHKSSNESDGDIVSLATDEFGSLQLGVTEDPHNVEERVDSFVSRKAAEIVKSPVMISHVTEESRGVRVKQKVDVGVQTMQEDAARVKSRVPPLVDVKKSREDEKKITIPIGFEDAQDVGKIRLPRWGQVKKADSSQRACTWNEARKSFEKFMKMRTVSDKTQGCKDEVGSNEDVNGRSMKEVECLLVDESRNDCKESNGETSVCNSEVTQGKKLEKDIDSQIRNEDVVKKTSVSTAQESIAKDTCGMSAIREIAKYKELLSYAFIGNDTSEGDLLISVNTADHDEVVAPGSNGNVKGSVESSTRALDTLVVSQKQTTDSFKDSNGATKIDDKPVSVSIKQTLESTEKFTPTKDSKTVEANDIVLIDQPYPNTAHHQSSTDSVEKSMPPVKELEKKVTPNRSTTGKKKGKPQRTKEHIFQMSTLGALMSQKEFDQALVGNPNISSCDGELDTNDTDKEKVQTFPHGKTNKAHTIDNKHISMSEPSRKDSLENTQVNLSTHKNVQEHGSSLSPSGDPVWAIFKNFKSAVLPSEIKRKEAESSEPEESSSELSSSSLCESDTSTCSSTSSDNDSGSSSDGESCENEGQSECKGNKLRTKESGKDCTGPNQTKASISGKLDKDWTYKGQFNDGQYAHDPNWSAEPSASHWDYYRGGWEYDGSHDYYPATFADTPYYGWQYPYYSPENFPNRYGDEYYQGGFSQQPQVYSGYPYPSFHAPYYDT